MHQPTPEQLARAVLTPANPKARETLRKLREKAEREKVDKAMKRVVRMAIVGLFLVSAADLSAQEWSPWTTCEDWRRFGDVR